VDFFFRLLEKRNHLPFKHSSRKTASEALKFASNEKGIYFELQTGNIKLDAIRGTLFTWHLERLR